MEVMMSRRMPFQISTLKGGISALVRFSLVCGFVLLPPMAQTEGVTQQVSFAHARGRTTEVVVYVNRSCMIQFDQPLARVSLAQPSVAEAVIISPTQLLLNGKAIGTSSLLAWSTAEPEPPMAFIVRVMADIQLILDQIAQRFPTEQIKVEQVDGRAVLSGTVSSKQVTDAILPLFEGTGLKPVNLTQVAGQGAPAQVLLQVRMAEVNRRMLRDLGANYSWFNPLNLRRQNEAIVGSNTFNPPGARFIPDLPGPNFTFSDAVNLYLFNPGTSLGAFIRALQQRNAFRSLAEPNIIAVNGQNASFLAGGEFPYPVVQPSTAGLAITVVFREFGVRLDFKPTIMDGNRIRLELAPEVSALDFVNALQLSGFRIPALISRKASTTVELADGQSFALAGLLSNDMTKVDSKIPLLGHIPILGYLFRSTGYIKNETELVFLCTARLVKPMNVEELPAIPGREEWKKEGLEGPFGYHIPEAGNLVPKPKEK
jgi:pilus assembly protein CpaC